MTEDSIRAILKTILAESCLKMGMLLPSLVLNLPQSSLGDCPPPEYLYQPGDCSCTRDGETLVFSFRGDAIAGAQKEMGEQPFLKGLVALANQSRSCPEDFRKLFLSFGKPVFRDFSGEEFDFLAYYPSGEPDAFYYCVKDEGGRCDYHRYTAADFARFPLKESQGE